MEGVGMCPVLFFFFFLINGIIPGIFLLGKTHPTARSQLMDLPKWRLFPWSQPAGKPISAEWKHSPYPLGCCRFHLGIVGEGMQRDR